MKNPLTPAGVEPATFWFVAQHLNHCATMVPVLCWPPVKYTVWTVIIFNIIVEEGHVCLWDVCWFAVCFHGNYGKISGTVAPERNNVDNSGRNVLVGVTLKSPSVVCVWSFCCSCHSFLLVLKQWHFLNVQYHHSSTEMWIEGNRMFYEHTVALNTSSYNCGHTSRMLALVSQVWHVSWLAGARGHKF